ncbi:hypothetical protein J6590_000689 [Homalodisca vitripennis]|nr:hypothetical protein J6590_000689 [Homalodisca vitripennis]
MASRKHELFDQDINELLGSEFSELSDSDDESDVDIFSRVRSGDFIFSELVRDADFNHDLGYLDEPVPGPSGDTVYSNNRPNKPTLDSVDLDTMNIMKAEDYKFPALKESDAMFSADTAPEWADGDCCHRCRVQFSMVQRKLSPNRQLATFQSPYHQFSEPETNLDEVKTRIQNHDKLEEADLETSLTLAAEAGNALLQENQKLKEEIYKLNQDKIVLSANLTSLESKIEAMSTNEEKHLNQIERLYEQLVDASNQLDKSKHAKFELQQFYEEYEQNQNQLLNQHLDKINSLEKTNRALTKQLSDLKNVSNQLTNSQTFCEKETQTFNNTPVLNTLTPCTNSLEQPDSLLTSPSLLIELGNIKNKQNDMERTLNSILQQFQAGECKAKQNTPVKKTANIKSYKLIPQPNNNFSHLKKNNFFSVSLQMAKSKLRTEKNGHLTTKLQSELSVGITQTPTEELSQPPLTGETSQTTIELHSKVTGGISQTPTEKLSQPPLTGETSQMTIELHSKVTGGISQTPTEKLPQPPSTGETSQRTIELQPRTTGGGSQVFRQTSFLEMSYKKKGRKKVTYPSRIFHNQSLLLRKWADK